MAHIDPIKQEDPLRPARGIATGVVIGISLWIIIIGALVLLSKII